MQGPFAAAQSHVGLVRSENQDSGYAGEHLFCVADGMGGHAGGDVASAIIARGIRGSDSEYSSAEEAAEALSAAVKAGNNRLQEAMREHPQLTGMGTTFSGIVRVGNQVALGHIGDSRIYRYRVGALEQMTTDHTFVQRLVDAGRITQEEAELHPRRNVVMRVLGNVEMNPEIDTAVVETRPGDRWLLCSDGLSSYVPEDRILDVMASGRSTLTTVKKLVGEALAAGAPDNVTVVLMDVVEGEESSIEPVLVGSAENEVTYEATAAPEPTVSLRELIFTPRQARARAARYEHFEPESEKVLEEILAEHKRNRTRRSIAWTLSTLVVLLAVVGTVFGFYSWTQTRYFVGANEDGYVAIYQGIQQDIGPVSLSTEVETTDIPVQSLSWTARNAVENTLNADSLQDAQLIVGRLRGGQ